MPQSIRNFPFLSNLATRVPLYPSATNSVLSGSQERNVGRLKCVPSAPLTVGVPIVLHEFLHVMRENVDGVHVIVHDPDVLFRIVRIDRHVVRALKEVIVLRERLDDFARRVHDGQAVLPLGIHSDDSLAFHPESRTVVGILARAAGARQG